MIGLANPPVVAKVRPDPSWVRGFCGIVEDGNPAYWTDGRDDVPPAMLLTLTMPPPWSPGGDDTPYPLCVRVPLPGDVVINSRQEAVFHRRLRLGELLTMREVVTDVSSSKRIPLGEGNFVTTTSTFTDEAGEEVAVLTNVLFRYRSGREA